MKPTQKVIKAFVRVDFPDLGVKHISAKIDTGAYSGAIHATGVTESVVDGHKQLEFTPIDGTTTVMKNFRTQHVKSSNGHITKRYVIDTFVVIKNQKYPISITLSNRSGMRKQVLIGRKFLRANGFVVDLSAIKRVR